jgi:hypothetical protein
MSGHVRKGLICPACGQPAVTCEYSWLGFGDSWDNFRHVCSRYGHTEERLSIPSRFPKETAATGRSAHFAVARRRWMTHASASDSLAHAVT